MKIFKERDKETKHKSVTIKVNTDEALRLISSLSQQLSNKDPNRGRGEFTTEDAEHFTIFVDFPQPNLEVEEYARLKQWGLIIALYAEDNNGEMQDNGAGMPNGQVWYNLYRPYYNNPKIRLCASAANPSNDNTLFDGTSYRGYADKAYVIVYGTGQEDDTGSFAMNSWIHTSQYSNAS